MQTDLDTHYRYSPLHCRSTGWRQMNIRRFFRPGPIVTNPANNPTKRTAFASGKMKATAPMKLDLIRPWLKKIMSLLDS